MFFKKDKGYIVPINNFSLTTKKNIQNKGNIFRSSYNCKYK